MGVPDKKPTSLSAPDPEQYLRGHRALPLCNLDLPAEFVLPDYSLSIANLPATMAGLLGAELPGAAPPLPCALWRDLSVGVQRVVCLILDAVGWLRFSRMLQDEQDLAFSRLSQSGRLVPITSVFPGTTTSALTSLWTGFAPAQHGLVGHNLYLPGFGQIVDTLGFSPAGQPRRGQMIERGLVPEELPCVPGLAETLRAQGVVTRTLIHHCMVESALSRLCFRGVTEVLGFATAADMCVCAADMLTAHADERLLLIAYWSEVDAISHTRGPDSRSWRAELRNVAFSLQREFLQCLPPAVRSGTLLLITADHGQTAGSADSSVQLPDHPRLQECLLMPPTGGPRSSYLYVRPRRLHEARGYLREELSRQFAVVDSAAALDAGLWGPGQPAAVSLERVGDLTVLGRASYMLDHTRREEALKGMHGGLSAWEMLVPLLLARLDSGL